MSDETETTTETTTDSGEATESTTAVELTDIEQEDKLDAELKASMPSPGELFGIEPIEPAPADDEPASEETETQADEADDATERPATATEPDDDSKPWTWSRVRKARKEIGSQREQLAAQQWQLQQQQQQLAPQLEAQQQLRQLGATDPAGAFRRFAELTGVGVDDLYQAVTEQRLRHGTEAEQVKVDPHTRALQQRLEAMEKAQKEQREAIQQREIAALRQREAQTVYQVATQDDSYPYLAALPPQVLETTIRTGVALAAELRQQQGVVRTVADVCSVLDQQAQKAYEYQHGRHAERLKVSSKAGASGANGGSGHQESSPDEGKPEATSQAARSERKRGKRGASNRAGAGTSAGARARTQDEIDDELEKLLRDGFKGNFGRDLM